VQAVKARCTISLCASGVRKRRAKFRNRRSFDTTISQVKIDYISTLLSHFYCYILTNLHTGYGDLRGTGNQPFFQKMLKKHIFPVTIVLLATAFAAPLQARDGEISQSHLLNDKADCTTIYTMGESTKGDGTIRSCWSAAISCASIKKGNRAYFNIDSGSYHWSSGGQCWVDATYGDLTNQREGMDWICRDGHDAWPGLRITTRLEL